MYYVDMNVNVEKTLEGWAFLMVQRVERAVSIDEDEICVDICSVSKTTKDCTLSSLISTADSLYRSISNPNIYAKPPININTLMPPAKTVRPFVQHSSLDQQFT